MMKFVGDEMKGVEAAIAGAGGGVYTGNAFVPDVFYGTTATSSVAPASATSFNFAALAGSAGAMTAKSIA